MPSDLTAEQRRAVKKAVASTHRLSDLPPEDRFQEAALGVLSAKVDPEREASDIEAYLCIRAIGSIRDAVRREMLCNMIASRVPKGGVRALLWRADDDDDELQRRLAPDDPERSLMVKRAVEAVAALDERAALIAQRFIEGGQGSEVAAECGITESRVCQIRRDIRLLVESHLA